LQCAGGAGTRMTGRMHWQTRTRKYSLTANDVTPDDQRSSTVIELFTETQFQDEHRPKPAKP